MAMTAPVFARHGELLADSDHRDAELAARLDHWRDGFRQGYEAGLQIGYGQALQQEADQRRDAAGLVRAATPGPNQAELELRRWGPGGREHFGDPRPGDFPGRGETA